MNIVTLYEHSDLSMRKSLDRYLSQLSKNGDTRIWNEGRSQSHGSTDSNGQCVINDLPNGTYIFSAKPPSRGARLLISPEKKVPPTSSHEFTVRMGPGCYYVIRRLRALINKQEFDKAEWLIASVKESYDDYEEHPVLTRITDFEKEISV